MRAKFAYKLLGICLVALTGCTTEYPCADTAISPSFVGFSQADIDTFVIRKFKPNDNYQTLIDTFVIRYGETSSYHTSNDTTTVAVFLPDANNTDKAAIKAGYDWQVFIPAKNRTISVSDIVSEKKTGKKDRFALDKTASCFNNVYSVKIDNQLFNFPASYSPVFYIRN